MADTAGGAGTIAQALAEARTRLREAGAETPDLDARLLAQEAFGLDSAGLMLGGEGVPEPGLRKTFAAMIERRLAGEPVHRILGRRAFYDHVFELSPATLEPRPDTEILVDLAARAMRERGAAEPVFADLGTGTGAIAVSLLAMFAGARCVAVDISGEALATARRNAAAAGVADRFLPLMADYLAPVAGPLDMVVSNPPYIISAEIGRLAREVRGHDPRLALDGGADGLDAYRRIADGLSQQRAAPADVLFEIGKGQSADVSAIMNGAGYTLRDASCDLSGELRALWFVRDR